MKEQEKIFIDFSQNIKQIFKQPEQVIREILHLRDKLIPDPNANG